MDNPSLNSDSEIYAHLNEVFRNVFDDNSLVVRPEMTAADVPEWDSFNHINLIVAIESRLKIKFNTAELENMRNVGEMAALVARKLGRA